MKKFWLLSLIALLVLIVPNAVYGNAGPTYHANYPGFNMVPIYNNHIIVLEEQIVFDISTNPGKFYSVKADVSVHYLFENISNLEEKVLLAFPFDSSEAKGNSKINILFDGIEVDHKVYGSKINYLSIDDPYFAVDYEYLPFSEVLAYLVNEAQTDKLIFGGIAGNTKVIVFELIFRPSEKHNLLVTYEMVPSMQRENTNIFPYFIEIPWHPKFYYYLEPAKYWQEFNDLTITIRTPKNFPLGYINLPGFAEVEPGYHVGNFDTLPEKNLQFLLVNSNSMSKMNQGIFIRRAILFIFLLLLLLMLFFIVKMIYKASFKKR